MLQFYGRAQFSSWLPLPFAPTSDGMETSGNSVASTITTTVPQSHGGQYTAPHSLIVNQHSPHSAFVPTSGLHNTQTGLYVLSHTTTAPIPPSGQASLVPGYYVTQQVPSTTTSTDGSRQNLQIVNVPFNGQPMGNTTLPSRLALASPNYAANQDPWTFASLVSRHRSVLQFNPLTFTHHQQFVTPTTPKV